MEKTNQIKNRDRTFELPIDILHIILSFLTAADQFRASLLSHSWKSAWDSLLIRDFDESLFKQHLGESYSDLFVEFVDVCIQRIHTQGLNLKTFRLRIVHSNSKNADSIDRWIKLLPKNSLKVLELNLYCDGGYWLPPSCLALNSLNFLSLTGCNLVESSLGDRIKFVYLKALHLTFVTIKDSTLLEIISHCRMINDLTINKCYGIENLEISSLPALLSIRIVHSFYYKHSKIKINSPSLQSFYYHGRILNNIVDLTCINLSDLTLKATIADEDLIESLIPKFPLLNTLVLDFHSGMHVIRISNPRLKSLKIRQVYYLREAHILAPNLEKLEISLSIQVILHLKSSILIDAAKLQKIELELNHSREIDTNGFLKLRDFLKQFVQKIILNLKIWSPQVKWNPDEIPDTYALAPVAIEHLNLTIAKEILRNYGEFIAGLFWSCHPNILSLRLSNFLTGDEIYMKTLCELIEKVDKPILNCCDSSQIKCWRHYLKSYKTTHANDGKIIDYKDFLRRANGFDADKVGSFSGNTEFPNLKIDFYFLWIGK